MVNSQYSTRKFTIHSFTIHLISIQKALPNKFSSRKKLLGHFFIAFATTSVILNEAQRNEESVRFRCLQHDKRTAPFFTQKTPKSSPSAFAIQFVILNEAQRNEKSLRFRCLQHDKCMLFLFLISFVLKSKIRRSQTKEPKVQDWIFLLKILKTS